MAHEPQNLANAVVIVACIYFILNFNFNIWTKIIVGGFLIFALATWAHWHQTKDQKELVRLGIRQTEANIQNLNAATAIAVANTKIIMERIGR